jgi:hypothetical protein
MPRSHRPEAEFDTVEAMVISRHSLPTLDSLILQGNDGGFQRRQISLNNSPGECGIHIEIIGVSDDRRMPAICSTGSRGNAHSSHSSCSTASRKQRTEASDEWA